MDKSEAARQELNLAAPANAKTAPAELLRPIEDNTRNTTIKRLPEDPTKKRRDYLCKKARVIVPAVVAGTASMLLIGYLLKLSALGSKMSNGQLAAFLLILVLTVPCTIILIVCEKKALSIPLVAPVRQQLTTLPAEEVLVRSSEQPAAAAGELVRASTPAKATASDQLLRATGDAVEVNVL